MTTKAAVMWWAAVMSMGCGVGTVELNELPPAEVQDDGVPAEDATPAARTDVLTIDHAAPFVQQLLTVWQWQARHPDQPQSPGVPSTQPPTTLGPSAQPSVSGKAVFDGSSVKAWSQQSLAAGTPVRISDVAIVPPGFSGTSMQVIIKDGDKGVQADTTADRERTELANGAEFDVGDEQWVEFWDRYDPIIAGGGYQKVLQAHVHQAGTQPPLSLDLASGKFNLKINNGGYTNASTGTPVVADSKSVWAGPAVTPGVWYHFQLHVKWGRTNSTGFIEMWADTGSGLTQVVPKTGWAAMSASSSGGWKKGWYRSGSYSNTTKSLTYRFRAFAKDPGFGQ